MMNFGEILSLEEVAGILKQSVKTVRRRIESGRLPSFAEGGRRRVLARDLEEYVEKQRKKGTWE